MVHNLVNFHFFTYLCIRNQAKKLHGTFLKLDTPNLDVSSHELREWIREGKSVKYYLPDSVISYIQEPISCHGKPNLVAINLR